MTTDHEFKVHDTESLQHGDRPLLARVYQPAGDGPFPLVIDVHGGAWTRNDRTTNVDTGSYLARHGIGTVSLDFRVPPVASYPASLADINFGIRWLKAHAGDFRGRAETVGAMEVAFYEGAGHGFILGNLQSPAAQKALGDIKSFILKHGT